MNINHRPIFDTQRVCELYSERDGVPVTYVCTSAPNENATYAADIYYRETPHPEFGNRYFGLYRNPDPASDGTIMITNADKIEDLIFNMVEVDGQWHYSKHRHDFHSVGDVAIDGGRAYLKIMGEINVPRATLKVVNGKFEEMKVDD